MKPAPPTKLPPIRGDEAVPTAAPASAAPAGNSLYNLFSMPYPEVSGVTYGDSGLPDLTYQPKHKVGTGLQPGSTMFSGFTPTLQSIFNPQTPSFPGQVPGGGNGALGQGGSDSGGAASEGNSQAGQSVDFSGLNTSQATAAIAGLLGLAPLAPSIMSAIPGLGIGHGTTPTGSWGSEGGEFGGLTSPGDIPGSQHDTGTSPTSQDTKQGALTGSNNSSGGPSGGAGSAGSGTGEGGSASGAGAGPHGGGW